MSIPDLLIAAARRYGVDPRLAVEVAIKESGLNPNTPPSSAGAIGIMQLMPKTARELGVDPYDLKDNIKGGVLYLKRQLRRFGRVDHALAAYNWGPDRTAAAVARWGPAWLDHTPAETQDYVRTIVGRLGEWKPQPAVTAQTVEKAKAALDQFRGLGQPQQAMLLVLAMALGAYWLYALGEE